MTTDAPNKGRGDDWRELAMADVAEAFRNDWPSIFIYVNRDTGDLILRTNILQDADIERALRALLANASRRRADA